MSKQRLTFSVFLVMLALAIVVGCDFARDAGTVSNPTQTPTPDTLAQPSEAPRVIISSPAAGQQFEPGQIIRVQSEALAAEGITRLELLVNDRVVETSEFLPQPNAALVTKQTWVADLPGRYVLQVRAFTPTNIVGQSGLVVVEISGDVAATTAEPSTATPTPTPPQPAIPATNTPQTLFIPFTPTPTATPAASPTLSYPYLQVKATLSLNVREGPSTQYQKVGVLLPGEIAEIVGRNDLNGPWWQIRFDRTPNGVGWVSASSDYSDAFNTGAVAVVAAPPLSTAPAPTATSAPTLTGTDFSVDRTQIRAGECVTFRWNVTNVKEVYYRGGGVPGDNQTRTECPTWTQYYELRVVYQDGTIDSKTIKIDVEGGSYKTIKMDEGESVDFDDNGKVSDDDGDDFKLREDDGDLVFRKWDDDDDLLQVPVGPIDSLDVIRRQDCDWALDHLDDTRTIEPFPGLAVCFRTDDGRIGKLRFDEVDDNDVEIEWALW